MGYGNELIMHEEHIQREKKVLTAGEAKSECIWKKKKFIQLPINRQNGAGFASFGLGPVFTGNYQVETTGFGRPILSQTFFMWIISFHTVMNFRPILSRMPQLIRAIMNFLIIVFNMAALIKSRKQNDPISF